MNECTHESTCLKTDIQQGMGIKLKPDLFTYGNVVKHAVRPHVVKERAAPIGIPEKLWMALNTEPNPK